MFNWRPLPKRNLWVLITFVLLSVGCKNMPSPEEKLVEQLPTNPQVQVEELILADDRQTALQGDPRYVPVRDTAVESFVLPTGSLFREDRYVGLFVQKRHYVIGDMIQVFLEEETSASKSLEMKKDKSSEMSVLPLEVNVGPIRVSKGQLNVEHDQSSAFSSASRAKQSNSLDGIVNVFVRKILNNGNLVVSGEKWIKLNEGEEYVRIAGEVRRSDIDASNRVSSQKIGNARIEYSGEGSLADNQAESVIDRILSVFN
ncbi:flagellar basal body L-ring protein FlgH [Bowmanella yangjiangensis]|uniref:Flagellar basal body L-ring protein FlgH n=1 Tax=Bowmanella yangjiangensis TaxID=2811230 RepID=A0ABS3CU93_9ALTE|nr:flagellar basal body L-ring protein FlgH [Bowmanella yangjiangensis]MBN7820094.1 flagellar basal body L-ring protein FlgH [Bowmanella yangjiangensis]